MYEPCVKVKTPIQPVVALPRFPAQEGTDYSKRQDLLGPLSTRQGDVTEDIHLPLQVRKSEGAGTRRRCP